LLQLLGNIDFVLGIWSQHRRDNLWCIWGWALSRGAGAAAWTFRSSRNSSTTVAISWDRTSCEIQVRTHGIPYNFICTKAIWCIRSRAIKQFCCRTKLYMPCWNS